MHFTRTVFSAFLILLSGGLVAQSDPARRGFPPSKKISGYNSEDGGLSGKYRSRGREKVYYLRQLEHLRRALPPRYIRVMDWKHYGSRGKILNKGILFTYSGYRARKVFLAGNFSNWRPIPLHRNTRGVYYYILPVRDLESKLEIKAENYVFRYKFLVDGIWMSDPVNKNRVDDGLGAYVSNFRLYEQDVNRYITVRTIGEPALNGERLVEFAIYLPRVQNLSLVGVFNNWNPEHDQMVKGKDGIFRLRLKLKPGEYVYKFIADGRWILDRYNPNTRLFEQLGELCSHIKIE